MDFGFILSSAAGELFSPTTAAYALATLGLAVHFGYTGLLNFGQAGFMALGAYGFAISTLTFHVPFFVGLLIAVVASAIFALLLGIPTLRLRADYLAIVTIAAAEIMRYIVTTNQLTAITGSANGLAAFEGDFYAMNPFPPGPTLGHEQPRLLHPGGRLGRRSPLSPPLVWLLMRSPWGRVLKGIREDENAVRSLGKNVYAYKMQSLIIGGVLGALAGMIFTLPRGAVQPANYGTELTFFLYTCLLLGGARHCARPGGRRDDLLGGALAHPGHPLRPDRVRHHHVAEHGPGRAAALHPGRRRAHAADDLQAPGRSRQQEGAGIRMSIPSEESRGRRPAAPEEIDYMTDTRPIAAGEPGPAARSAIRSWWQKTSPAPSAASTPSTSSTSRSRGTRSRR